MTMPVRVLITRPQGQGDDLKQLLKQAGIYYTHQPLLHIRAIDPQQPAPWQAAKQRVLALDSYQKVIFISTNAVQYGMTWLEDYWPQLPLEQQFFAIGNATAAALAEWGVIVAAKGEATMTSETLLAQPFLSNVAGEKILIVRGMGGRDHLQQALQQRGAKVEYLECYQRLPPDYPDGMLYNQLQTQKINTICLNSGETLNNFVLLLGECLKQCLHYTIIVPSRRVEKIAEDHGFRQIITAANAGTQATFKAIQWLQQSD